MRLRFSGLLAVFLVVSHLATAAPKVTIAGYNLRNYLTMSRRDANGSGILPKPEAEIDAVVRSIGEIKPDILGVCEMGTAEDFADFRAHLEKAGLNFKDAYYVEADDERHLALLSNYPIIAKNPIANLSYTLDGKAEVVRRGFLDVTIQITDDYQLRVIGAHLKSKRPVPEGETLVRRHEAQLLREHIESILKEDPEVNLIVYGDFNDTKNEPPISEIRGRRNSANYMEDLWIKDSAGDRWTQYWDTADLYSRFDYFFVNKALRPEVKLDESYVFRADYGFEGSDHRPIVAVIEAENK